MSRIGKKPVIVPSGVKVEISATRISAKGPAGELSLNFHPSMLVAVQGSDVVVNRPDDKRSSRALHGLTRSLIHNMVAGVVKPFEKKLEINRFHMSVEAKKATKIEQKLSQFHFPLPGSYYLILMITD